MNDKIKIKGAREHPAPNQALRLSHCRASELNHDAWLVTGQVT